MASCIDCGNPTGGKRCKTCHGRFLAEQALDETAARDAELLQMVDVEGVSGTRIAARFGISRARASQKIAQARERTRRREAGKVR